MKAFSILFIFLGLISCVNNLPEEVKRSENINEIKKILNHYDRTKREKKEGAEFLIDNIGNKYRYSDTNALEKYSSILDSVENERGTYILISEDFSYLLEDSVKYQYVKDMDIIHSDSLIHHIDTAFDIWGNVPWSKEYTMDQFYEYVLPYRGYMDPVEYSWREKRNKELFSKISHARDTDISEVMKLVNKECFVNIIQTSSKYGAQGFSSLNKRRRGDCLDQANYALLTMRSMGIPTAMDFTINWGNQHGGHFWDAVILPDESSIPFAGGMPLDEPIIRHKPVKIFRKTFQVQRESLIYDRRYKEDIPPEFARFDFKDVSKDYNLELYDLEIDKSFSTGGHRIAYLNVFNVWGWLPSSYGEIGIKKVKYKDIGNGEVNSNYASIDSGENIGTGILFLPTFYENGNFKPISYPFILDGDGNIRMKKPLLEQKEKIVLDRKFPRRKRVILFAERMIGGRIEVANQKDFSDAVLIHEFNEINSNRPHYRNVSDNKKYKYIRFYKPRNGLCFSELSCYDNDGVKLDGKIIGSDILLGQDNINNLFDNDFLSYFDIQRLNNVWIGLELDQPTAISKIICSPRTDENDIYPGDLYELFYWNNRWESLGKQTASSYELIYDNVPKNSVLWLRNLSKGIEERPFTYEQGKQIWW